MKRLSLGILGLLSGCANLGEYWRSRALDLWDVMPIAGQVQLGLAVSVRVTTFAPLQALRFAEGFFGLDLFGQGAEEAFDGRAVTRLTVVEMVSVEARCYDVMMDLQERSANVSGTKRGASKPQGAQVTNVSVEMAPADAVDPVIEAYKRDVDRTLLRENLKLTPEQRAQKLVAFAKFASGLKEAGRRARAAEENWGLK